MVGLPDTMWVHAGSLVTVTKWMREYLAQIDPVGPDRPSKAYHNGYPKSFAGKFPARVVQARGGVGVHNQNPRFPEELRFHVQVFDRLGRNHAEAQDSITRAEDGALEGFSSWLDAFFEDAFVDTVRSIAIPEWSAAAGDTAGRAFVDMRTAEYLWRLRADVRVAL